MRCSSFVILFISFTPTILRAGGDGRDALLDSIRRGGSLKTGTLAAGPLQQDKRKTYDQTMQYVQKYVLEQWHDDYVATDLTGIAPMDKEALVKKHMEERALAVAEDPTAKKGTGAKAG